MKLVVLSYSHHGRSIGRAALGLGHDIVGAMDSDPQPRQALGAELECPTYSSAGACLDEARPDAALVAGRHTEMPDHVAACIDRRIPFLLDKPFADCAARLRPVAEECQRLSVANGLTLPNRVSRLATLAAEAQADGWLGDPVLFNSRLNNGSPSRYDTTASAWHNDAAISGGGCWATEAAHGIDAFLQFVGDREVEAVGAVVSNAMHRRPVEDVALGLLRTQDGVTGIVESGYCYPSGARSGDHFARYVGTKATIMGRYDRAGEHVIEIHTTDGVRFEADRPHSERMSQVIADGLQAVGEGRCYEVSVTDAVRILEVQDAVYERARAQPRTNGPQPMDKPPARPATRGPLPATDRRRR